MDISLEADVISGRSRKKIVRSSRTVPTVGEQRDAGTKGSRRAAFPRTLGGRAEKYGGKLNIT